MNIILVMCAPSNHRKVVKKLQVSIAEVIQRLCYWPLKRGFKMLELYEVKVSRTVLRGGSGGNATFLPD